MIVEIGKTIMCEGLNFPKVVDGKKIPLYVKLIVRVFGSYRIFTLDKVSVLGREFKLNLDFYLLYCKKHRVYYVDFLHGFEGKKYFLGCPLCVNEYKKFIDGVIGRENC